MDPAFHELPELRTQSKLINERRQNPSSVTATRLHEDYIASCWNIRGRWEKHTECLMYYLPVVEHMKEKIQVVKFWWHRGDLQRRDSLSFLFGLTSFHFNQRSENRRSVNKSRGVANKQVRTDSSQGKSCASILHILFYSFTQQLLFLMWCHNRAL